MSSEGLSATDELGIIFLVGNTSKWCQYLASNKVRARIDSVIEEFE